MVELDCGLGAAGIVDEARLEGRDVQLDPGVDPDAHRVAIDVEQAIGWEVCLGQALPDQPQGLATGAGRTAAHVGPEVGERLTRARAPRQHEQRQERLGVASRKPDVAAGRGPRIEAAEQIDLEPDVRAWSTDGHRRFRSRLGRNVRPVPPPRAGRAGSGRQSPQTRPPLVPLSRAARSPTADLRCRG